MESLFHKPDKVAIPEDVLGVSGRGSQCLGMHFPGQDGGIKETGSTEWSGSEVPVLFLIP